MASLPNTVVDMWVWGLGNYLGFVWVFFSLEILPRKNHNFNVQKSDKFLGLLKPGWLDGVHFLNDSHPQHCLNFQIAVSAIGLKDLYPVITLWVPSRGWQSLEPGLWTLLSLCPLFYGGGH